MKVFINGCFDLLHEGHIDFLKQAKSHGDFLVVGLNSDSSVRKNKGVGRPVDNQEIRKQKLLSTGYVDEVIVFDDSNPIRLIKEINPDLIIRGHDQKIEPELSDFRFVMAKKFGDISTTKLLNSKK